MRVFKNWTFKKGARELMTMLEMGHLSSIEVGGTQIEGWKQIDLKRFQ